MMGTFTWLSSTVDLVKLIDLLSFASKVGNYFDLMVDWCRLFRTFLTESTRLIGALFVSRELIGDRCERERHLR